MLVVFLCAVLLLLTAWIYSIVSRCCTQRPGEPHLVKGNWLLGSGADFAKDAVALLHSCAKQYGDIFTLRLLHQRITFVADVHSFDAFARHRQFDFDPIQRQVNWNVFGYVVLDPKRLVANSTNLLKGASLGRTLARFANNLTEVISDLPVANDVNGNMMSQGGKLRDFLAETFFTAQFATMFGRDAEGQQFTARLAYENLEVFHRYFNYLWLGVPMYLFPPALRAIRSLSQQPTSDDFLARPDISDWLRAEIQVLKEDGQTESEMRAHRLVYLHINYNTFRLAFWAAYQYIASPSARADLRRELLDTLGVGDVTTPTADTKTLTLTVKQLDRLPVLDSFVQETVRLAGSAFMVRGVAEDTWFRTSSGQEHLVRAGDMVAIYPPAIHRDPGIFTDPLTFNHQRFVGAKFYKNGVQVQHPLVSFGSLCPGKRYALLEIKCLLVQLMTQLDVQLVEGECAHYDTLYYGHEILPPVNDIGIFWQKIVPSLSVEIVS